MKSLKTILTVNALSSGATGLLLVIAPGFFADLFGIEATSPFVFTGWFLVLFAAFVQFVAITKAHNPGLVNLIIMLDVAWVIGSIVAILFLMNSISVIGSLLIGGVAIWVAAMAYYQNRFKVGVSHRNI